jgi:hypothetical protein
MRSSQNGEQSSGQLTTTPSWFGGSASSETPSQTRSDQVLKLHDLVVRVRARLIDDFDAGDN